MKRIITLLLIILVSIPVTGQITKQSKQEFANLMTSKIFKPVKKHQKKFKDFQTPDFKYNSNKNKFAKSSIAEKKTLDSLISQEWDNDFNLWRNEIKEEFIYDGEKIDTRLLYLWNGNTSSWELFQKVEYSFDTNGNVSSKTTSYQFTPPVWVFDKKTDYSYILDYNSLYQLSLEENYTWDSIASQWINTYKHELTYGSGTSFLSLEIGSEWDLGTKQWRNMYRDEFIYDDLLSSEINSYWDNGTSAWVLNSKWEYSRGDFHPWVPDFVILYRRDINNIEWVYESKNEYEYGYGPDAFPILAKETWFTWDISMEEWEVDYKDEYEYDGNFNRTLGSYFEWNETPGEWVEYAKDEFVFDLAYDFRDDLTVPYNYAEEVDDTVFMFNNMVIGYLYFEYVNQVWEDDTKTLFYYADYTNQLSVDEKILPNAISVYPNPTADVLVIDSNMPLTKVEMYSVLGKKVMDINTGFKSIPMHKISAGLYIVKIQSENAVILKKIIKK